MNTVPQSVKLTERSAIRLRSSVPPLSTVQAYQSPATQHVIAIPPSQASAGQTGACAVCERDGLHIIHTTGLLRNHGPWTSWQPVYGQSLTTSSWFSEVCIVATSE